MRSVDIRALRTQFRESKAPAERYHARSTPASLIVNSSEDPTTMFTTAGMQPLVPYLMGKPHPGGKRVYNIQGCVRTTDIEEVGDDRHLTFFEMMGNRSLGDYFKKEAIARSREFLTSPSWLGLDPGKFAVTVFAGDADAPRDDESAFFWQEIGVPVDRISYLGKKDNRWGPAGSVGPCGPDTEIFYWVGPGAYPPAGSNVGNDEDNRLEVWNNVFMQYYKNEGGAFEELPAKNVDTGMGFERISMVVQHASGSISKPLKEATVYDTDIFSGIITLLDASVSDQRRKRIMADHLRTSFFLIQEGLIPSNEGRGYVLRRIIRSMFFQWYQSQGHSSLPLFEELLYAIKEVLNALYGDCFTNTTLVTILQESSQFASTIVHGQKIFEEYKDVVVSSGKTMFPGDLTFKLYDTYGFPVELTILLCQECGLSVDEDGYEQAMNRARDLSRAGSAQMFAKDTDRASVIEGVQPTRFVGYETTTYEQATLLKDVYVGEQRCLIFDVTPFYAEGGGQKGDYGQVELDTGEVVQIVDVIKYGGVWVHKVG